MRFLILLALVLSLAPSAEKIQKTNANDRVPLQDIQNGMDEIAAAKHKTAEKVKGVLAGIQLPSAKWETGCEDASGLERVKEWQLALKQSCSEDAIIGMGQGMLNEQAWPLGFWARAKTGQFRTAAPKR